MPRIRYCRTPAGRVAYSTSGTGPALLLDTGWITDLRGQLELFSFGAFIERLAKRFTVIRYDKPGCGLSDRNDIDLSFDGQVGAALAVADVVGAGRFCMFGASQGGQLATAVRRTELSPAVLRFETRLARAACLAMAVFLSAGCVWIADRGPRPGSLFHPGVIDVAGLAVMALALATGWQAERQAAR